MDRAEPNASASFSSHRHRACAVRRDSLLPAAAYTISHRQCGASDNPRSTALRTTRQERTDAVRVHCTARIHEKRHNARGSPERGSRVQGAPGDGDGLGMSRGPDPPPSTCGTCGNRADPTTLSWWWGVPWPARPPEFLDPIDKNSWCLPCQGAAAFHGGTRRPRPPTQVLVLMH